MKRLSILLFAAAIIGAFLTVPGMALASDKTDAQAIVTKANMTFNSFMSDKNFTEMRKLSRSAKGIFIAPQVLKGAFVWGASGGTGVFLVREEGGHVHPSGLLHHRERELRAPDRRPGLGDHPAGHDRQGRDDPAAEQRQAGRRRGHRSRTLRCRRPGRHGKHQRRHPGLLALQGALRRASRWTAPSSMSVTA